MSDSLLPPFPAQELTSLCLGKKRPYGAAHPDSKIEKCLRVISNMKNHALLAFGPKCLRNLG